MSDTAELDQLEVGDVPGTFTVVELKLAPAGEDDAALEVGLGAP